MTHNYTDPVTGATISGTVPIIVERAMRIRRQQGHKTTRDVVYGDVIKQIQKKNSKTIGKRRHTIRFRDALKAGQAAIKIISGDTVSPAEMVRRYKVCQQCPLRTKTRECFSCNAARFLTSITSSMRKMFGKQVKTPSDSKKFSCGVCNCLLAMLLPTKVSHLHEDNEHQSKRRPDFCWMKEGSANFRKS